MGLLFMKSKGLSHRDIKTKNLILFENGKRIKIADFGISLAYKN